MTVVHLMLTAFGLGLLRPAPGTWGSAFPVAVVLAVICVAGTAGLQLDVIIALLGLAFAAACLRFGGEAEARFGRKDPGQVVADEVAGQCVALLFLPWRSPSSQADLLWNFALAGTAFLSFRLFDIVKPPPARKLQRLPGGMGILVDDLFAGAYALVLTHLAVWQLWPLVFDH